MDFTKSSEPTVASKESDIFHKTFTKATTSSRLVVVLIRSSGESRIFKALVCLRSFLECQTTWTKTWMMKTHSDDSSLLFQRHLWQPFQKLEAGALQYPIVFRGFGGPNFEMHLAAQKSLATGALASFLTSHKSFEKKLSLLSTRQCFVSTLDMLSSSLPLSETFHIHSHDDISRHQPSSIYLPL